MSKENLKQKLINLSENLSDNYFHLKTQDKSHELLKYYLETRGGLMIVDEKRKEFIERFAPNPFNQKDVKQVTELFGNYNSALEKSL